MPAQVASGPTIMRVGERSDKDKKFASDEYVYADPGVGGTVVVAPRPRGEAPSMENAAKAVLKQLGQYPKGTKGTYLEAASGAVIAKLMGRLGEVVAAGGGTAPGLERAAFAAKNMISGLESGGGVPRVIPSAIGAGEIAKQVRMGGVAEYAPEEIAHIRKLMATVGVPESGIEGLAATGPAMEAMPRLEREVFQAGTGVRQTGARTLEGAERLTRQQAVEKFARQFGEAETPLVSVGQGESIGEASYTGAAEWIPKIKNYESATVPERFKGFLSTDGTMFGVNLDSIRGMQEPHHDDITIAMGLGRGGRGGSLLREGVIRVSRSEIPEGGLFWIEAFDPPNPKQVEFLARASKDEAEITVGRAHRGKTDIIDMLGAVFPNFDDAFTLYRPIRPTILRRAFAELFPEARMAPGELKERAVEARWAGSEWAE